MAGMGPLYMKKFSEDLVVKDDGDGAYLEGSFTADDVVRVSNDNNGGVHNPLTGLVSGHGAVTVAGAAVDHTADNEVSGIVVKPAVGAQLAGHLGARAVNQVIR